MMREKINEYNKNNSRELRLNNQSNKWDKEDDCVTILINEIKGKPLKETLTCERINLSSGEAYKIGEFFSGKKKGSPEPLNTNQLRKYFEQITNAVRLDDFTEKRNALFKVLPQIAYAVGRKVCPKKFYDLIDACISKSTLTDNEDINTFVDFLTAIVAYSKFFEK